jgi:putative transcriptional regulator
MPDHAHSPSEGGTSEAPSFTGRLLVAAPSMLDPRFHRCVVLVLDHDHTGTLGVILNRQLEVPVREVLPDWTGDVSAPDTLFGGGPVSPDSALAVGVLDASTSDAPVGWRMMHGRVGLVDLDTPVELLAGALLGMRIFAGYAGWSPGQLEAEVDEGGWLVVQARDEDIVTSAPDRLWTDVLRRQEGDMRLLATHPADPAMN